MKKVHLLWGIGIFVLISLTAFFFYYTKQQNLFTDSTGTYSFEYPKNFQIAEKSNAVILSTNLDNPESPSIIVAPGYYVDFLALNRDIMKSKISLVTIGNHKVYKIEPPIQESQPGYILPLEEKETFSRFIEIYKIGNIEESQIEIIIKSMKFDTVKMIALIEKQKDSLAANEEYEKVKINLSNLRIQIENYYKKGDKKYTNLCSPLDTPLNGQYYQDIIKSVGLENFSCRANQKEFIISTRLANGSRPCFDSVGLSRLQEKTSNGESYSCK